jgi:exodeoxyribonuclease V alpha subunit
MQNNINTGLDSHVREFFNSLGAGEQVIELASNINSAVEKGSTAIVSKDVIDSPLVGVGSSGLLVQDNGLAGFRRHYNQEQFILSEFLNREDCMCDLAQAKDVVSDVVALFGENSDNLDMQWQGSVGSLLNNRIVITGGPGTGKTTAIVRLVALHHGMYPDNIIGFCAPTGKAANKIISSVALGLSENNLDGTYPELKNIKSMTLHRLLGYNHISNKFKYNARNPLPYDLLVVDEASMLDGSLMESVLQALKPSAKLVLAGDKNQLPSVGAGNVFEDICDAVKGKDVRIESVSINDMLENPDGCGYYELTHNYRFDDDSTIAKLCNAALIGDEGGFVGCIGDFIDNKEGDHEFVWENPINYDDKIRSLKSWHKRCSVIKSDTSVMLSPYNHGPYGVAELNGLAKSIEYGGKDRFVGMPVMVLKNDYAIGVFNGDIGVLGYDGGQWHVDLVIDGVQRNVSIDSVQWICASAMSVNKAQGIEYDHILIALNADRDKDSVLSRRLLYTALSRARKSITIWSDRKSITKVLATKGERLSFMQSFIKNSMC